MKLAIHELSILSELSMSYVNSIANMTYMLKHVQYPQLKSILERHFLLHVRGKVGGMYQVVTEDPPQMQQYLDQYQNPMLIGAIGFSSFKQNNAT